MLYPSFESPSLDGDSSPDGADLDFVYADADTCQNEIAELYSYSELPNFKGYLLAFKEQMILYNVPTSWKKQDAVCQRSVIMRLIDQLEVTDRGLRMQSARCILYLVQGCWAEVLTVKEQRRITRNNVIMLYELGVFQSFIDLMNIEIERASTAAMSSAKTKDGRLEDSADLRVILSVLYIITETIRDEQENNSEDYKEIVVSYIQELNSPLPDGELLSLKLLNMLTVISNGGPPQFPLKRIVLLLWKVSLLGLGGTKVLKELKNEYRVKAGLSPITEDTLDVAKRMRSSTPPPMAVDVIKQRASKANVFLRRLGGAWLQRMPEDQEEESMEQRPDNDFTTTSIGSEDSQCFCSFEESASSDDISIVESDKITARIPWTPKVRQEDVVNFLNNSRHKFIGYSLLNDNNSLAGLPQPIQESVKTLQSYIYTGLADIQIKNEEDLTRYPLSAHEDEVQMTPAEILYQAMLPNLPKYMIALLKVLLAASPSLHTKNEGINIVADLLPKSIPFIFKQSFKLTVDIGRHKEIIVKAVSAIILIYLKHFKLNHVYQFEFMSQHLVLANCIPLALKFFSQNAIECVNTENSMPMLDFPFCVIGEESELSDDLFVYNGDVSDMAYSWRNVFSRINLLRILNKVVKWKPTRIKALISCKAKVVLKRSLRVRHATLQLYALKLMKLQSKYLGRQWRRSNMPTITAIYAKVRHRFNDNWAFGNDSESQSSEFEMEECTLEARVDRFHLRRYREILCRDDAIDGVETELNKFGMDRILGESVYKEEDIVLTDYFKANYEKWLEDQVYNQQIDWDAL